jgi:hypothetical protein
MNVRSCVATFVLLPRWLHAESTQLQHMVMAFAGSELV